MPGSLLGNAVRRVEDPGLLHGSAEFVDDLRIPGALHGVFVRSPYPHARVRSVEIGNAEAMDGVTAVFTADNLGVAPYPVSGVNRAITRAPLIADTARYAGDPVALVVAESVAQALDAAEAVDDYEPLDAVTGIEAALSPGAPLLFEELGSNLMGGAKQAEGPDVMDGADIVVRARLLNQRVAVAPMEPNAIAVEPGSADGVFALTIQVATQMPHRVRDAACEVFKLDADEVRVMTPYVGGGFGGKTGLVPEFAAIIGAVRVLDRPIKWIETRSENLVGMNGRSQVQYVEMGFRRSGEIVGLRCRVVGDGGAYGGFGGMLAMGPTRNMAQGVYRMPQMHFDVASALTNTSSTGAFRGAGRPEAAALLERLMDLGADELGIDPVDIRRMNFIQPDQFPFTTLTGMLYDSGDYDLALREVLWRADYAGLRADQARRRASGDTVQLGIGLSTYVEITAGGPSGEYGAVEVLTDGSATIRVGTTSTGQGHATSFSMLVSHRLGIPLERIRFIQADTAEVPRGGGTVGSRSLQLGGVAVSEAAGALLERAKELVGELLEADPQDVVLSHEGTLGVAGVPATALGWDELASVAAARGEVLEASVDFRPPGATFPFGAHISLVEVDLETGKVRPVRHVAVDDAGRIVNPLLAAGQQHGGIAQGMAQALWEEVLYDEDGSPVAGNFATYCIPSAAEVCFFETSNTETPTPSNPLGAKGIGESATIGATPAVQNAVVDALSHLGVRHVDMPCTPERVWRAIETARAGTIDEPWREPPPLFHALPERPPLQTRATEETH